ncbi:uncharacterized protein PFL1_00519 [Pseudozyma flocculosa PF-1]|uniref:Carbonic anhydrase n=1 Tax=Pseudozyma flocculosa TaxID=84751 RepID=A0A5C3ER86_9BASI|nr:uncharacterized protein PFL1_00519 [Pseudozyma flocculosa PF-1]EPQ32323.1 hypothetical protein PFL1_00519 [Pseudozyma flocculosa PF-1]SPO34718.1 related to carbonic anhydrase [Pseudozyma flocculosa]
MTRLAAYPLRSLPVHTSIRPSLALARPSHLLRVAPAAAAAAAVVSLQPPRQQPLSTTAVASRPYREPRFTKLFQLYSQRNDEDAMVQHLLERNVAWSSKTKETRPALLEELSKSQSPKVLWVGCADSRIPESVICGADPGEIFVTRNIANQFRPDDDNANSVLEFAVQALGVEHVVVVGHTSCGGVIAAINGSSNGPPPDEAAATPLFRHLTPLTKLAYRVAQANPGVTGAELNALVTRESVREQVDNVVKSATIQSNWKEETSPLSGKVMKKVQVHGWLYDLAAGQLKDLNLTRTANA